MCRVIFLMLYNVGAGAGQSPYTMRFNLNTFGHVFWGAGCLCMVKYTYKVSWLVVTRAPCKQTETDTIENIIFANLLGMVKRSCWDKFILSTLSTVTQEYSKSRPVEPTFKCSSEVTQVSQVWFKSGRSLLPDNFCFRKARLVAKYHYG